MCKQRLIPILLLLSTLAGSLVACGYSKSDLAAAEQQGYEQGYQDGYNEGYDYGEFSGYVDGYDTGYDEGYFDGLLDDDTEVTEPEGGWPKIEKDK